MNFFTLFTALKKKLLGGGNEHGPISLIVDGMPAVFITVAGPQYEKIMGNIEEVRARGGKIIAVAAEGDETIKNKKSNPACRQCPVFLLKKTQNYYAPYAFLCSVNL